MRWFLGHLCASTLVLVLSTSSPALAQSSSADVIEQARALMARGREALARGDLAIARGAFEEAYRLTENPAMRFNLSVVEERAGHREAAIDHLRAFLASSPSEPTRGEAEERLEALLAESSADPPATHEADIPPPPPTERDWTAFGVTLGVGALLGGALLTTSAVTWGEANAAFSGLETRCMLGCSQAAVDASGGPMNVDLTNAFLVAGIGTLALTVIVSVILAVLDSTPTHTAAQSSDEGP